MSGMQGKVVVLTGGTSGIGEAAALKLAKMGARLVLVVRDASRAEVTLKRLQKVSPTTQHTTHLADLSLVAETQRVAREIAVAEPRIDVLINNAGLICARRQVTADGYEPTLPRITWPISFSPMNCSRECSTPRQPASSTR